ncbi:phage Gp37/Gp68 family protein [Leptospira sp. GIMC2001]|uniref:phage Gp37/Gp68 family protein n=1 Tax=Leptospira sp. GIMC2001 TaxID=1513297 RepID=UPI0023491691|nr:phage Gp37/Gp68 family protein [Leptospira sp. GIMC2001]WCL51451.1 phage Gp37/Gp68 family protein [Leptospira sp. GIMC2001]
MNNSRIEWTDHTHNEWIGCEKISDGCKNCYAEDLMDKRYKKAKWGAHGNRVLTSINNRNKPFSWDRKAGKEGIRYKVFAQSLSDTFEDREELESWRVELFTRIKLTTNLDWLILTKRPDVAKKFFEKYPEFCDLPNVWLGVSVENQKAADERIPILLDIPCKVRFLSMEPLLGEIDLTNIAGDIGIGLHSYDVLNGKNIHWDDDGKWTPCSSIDWIIVGGESGHNARPMHPNWVRSIRDQCQKAAVPFFFKQWGEWVAQGSGVFIERVPDLDKIIREHDTSFYKVGKKRAGAKLDGMEWKVFPRKIY